MRLKCNRLERVFFSILINDGCSGGKQIEYTVSRRHDTRVLRVVKTTNIKIIKVFRNSSVGKRCIKYVRTV